MGISYPKIILLFLTIITHQEKYDGILNILKTPVWMNIPTSGVRTLSNSFACPPSITAFGPEWEIF